MAATLIFLQIKDKKGNFILGESTAANYSGQIEVESFNWEVEARQSVVAGSDKSSSQVDFKVLEVTKFYDKATSSLCLMMGNDPTVPKGKPPEPLRFDYAVLSFVDMIFGERETTGIPVVEIELTDGFIEKIELKAAASGKSMRLEETIELSYRHVKLIYYVGGIRRSVRGKASTFAAHTASVKT